jgi:hypothetical protein
VKGSENMEYKYQDYYEERNTNFPTSIHTRINSQYRISTIFRRASTIEPMYFWETFIWDGDKIYDSESHNSIDGVLQYHYDKYFELGGL